MFGSKFFILILVVAVVVAGCAPSDSPVPRDQALERYQKGIEKLSVFDYAGAIPVLRPVPNSFEVGTKEWARGTFALASALRHNQPLDQERVIEATSLFEQLAEKSPEPKLRGLALLELGRIAELPDFPDDQKDVAKAAEYYRQIQKEFPQTAIEDEALLREANLLFKTGDPVKLDEGIAMLRKHLADDPDTELAVVIWQTLAHAEIQYRNDPEKALEAYEEAAQRGFAVPAKADNYLWTMVLLATKTGDEKTLAELYRRVIVDTPRSPQGSIARQRLQALAEKYPEWNIVVPERPSYMNFNSTTRATDGSATDEEGGESNNS